MTTATKLANQSYSDGRSEAQHRGGDLVGHLEADHREGGEARREVVEVVLRPELLDRLDEQWIQRDGVSGLQFGRVTDAAHEPMDGVFVIGGKPEVSVVE